MFPFDRFAIFSIYNMPIPERPSFYWLFTLLAFDTGSFAVLERTYDEVSENVIKLYLPLICVHEPSLIREIIII